MYWTHFSLRESPFRQSPGKRWFFHGPAQEEALARLHFVVEQRHPLALLAGVPGCGKSLLLEIFASQQRAQSRDPLFLSAKGADLQEFWWRLADGLRLNPPLGEAPFRVWRRICDRLDHLRSLERDLLLLLDDVDGLQPCATQGLVRLLALNRRPESRLIIVASAESEHLADLDPGLINEAELRIEVPPLSRAETAEYLQACAAQAGNDEPLFSNAAVTRLYELSGGVPRRINQLAELALIAAAGQGLGCVDAQTLEGVHLELCARLWTRRKAA